MTAAAAQRRWVDAGAVFAGWVGVGMALLVAIGLELIVAVQSLVFLFAPVGGLLIGFYANARSARRRPWSRVLANAAWAGLVAALALALIYGAVRLLFVYADAGYRDTTQGGVISCPMGPACTYQRYLDAGRGPALEAAGVTDVASFEAYLLREQLSGALILAGLTLGGALAGGALYGAGGRGGDGSTEPAPD